MKNFKLKANLNVIQRAFRDSIPVMTGYIVLGVGFGILLKVNGYNAFWAFLMGVIIYSGAMQFIMINMITGGATLLATALTSLMIGARHLFYGISMLGRYKNISNKLKKFYVIYALTDETYALVSSYEKKEHPSVSYADSSPKGEPSSCFPFRGVNATICVNAEQSEAKGFINYCFYVSLFDQIYWVTGSVLGGILGSFIPFNTTGIDFALTALFISICVEQWRDGKDKKTNHLSALTGFGASLACLLLFGRDNFLIPAMIAITIILFLLKPVFNDEKY